ncbi:MAG TPA: nucleotidyltransferase family protein [Candidatus Omnitrophota bacterium]|nr:nucleotidyltransferase family protein [Candidatus Omnitrophota bacterium]HNQ50582.1 nucleotidyltransferase family protein [Candidatus Omnitrophota bacterium]
MALDKAPEQFILSVLKGGKHSAADDLPSGLLSGEVFWRDVLDAAVREGVFYPFYKGLLASDPWRSIIPESIRERYRQTYYLHAAKSSVFMLQVSRVLSCLESRTIDVLLFKGPTVDSCIYDDYWRPRLDIDIAVKPADMPVLEQALRDSGYTAPEGAGDYPIPEYLNSRLFTPVADELVPVHVHRHLVNNMFLTVDGFLQARMEAVWQQAQPFKDYRRIYTLSPEMNIVYLCEHGLKHDLDQMAYLYEISCMLIYYGKRFDWEKFLVLTRLSGLSRVVYCGLFLAKEMFGIDVPDKAIEAVAPARMSAGERTFLNNALALKHARYGAYPVYCALRKGTLKQIYFMFRTIFPPGFGLKGYLARIQRACDRR